MNPHRFSILVFTLSGRFACFRKFYTNASSLSYLIPPRTVITGMLASLLEIPRDEYYETLSAEQCHISVSVSPSAVIRKSTQSINMLHADFFNFLRTGATKYKSMHTQNKLELLLGDRDQNISYTVYVAMDPENESFRRLVQAIELNQNGFGLYLGQRQFRASCEFIACYTASQITFLPEAQSLDSVCLQENVLDLTADPNTTIVKEQMPLHMKACTGAKNKSAAGGGRETIRVAQVLFEQEGKRFHGRFKNCWQVGDKIISFY